MKEDKIKNILEKIKSEQRYLSGHTSIKDTKESYEFVEGIDVKYRTGVAYGGCVVMGSKENVISTCTSKKRV